MKVLFFGDVVGSPGRNAVRDRIQDLREQHEVDFVVLNAENVAGGFGITPQIGTDLLATGVDVLTSGNHVFDKYEVLPYIAKEKRLLRPANYSATTPGRGMWVGDVRGIGVAVINLIGRVFMHPSDDPFRIVDELLATIPDDVKVRIVDMHAEATSEKSAMGWYLDGRVSTVVGTHTHVQTADERILPGGTAYITDLGMTGSYSGVIGMDKDDVIARFKSAVNRRAAHSTGDVRICGAVIDIDETTGLARNIMRLSLPHRS